MTKHKELTLEDVIDNNNSNINKLVENADLNIEKVIERVNAHTSKEVEELAGITARQFSVIEKRIDKFEDRMDNRFDDVRTHLVRIDNHIGLKAKFEFSEA